MNQRGFSLIEMGIATACALLLILGASTMATQAMQHHQQASGKLDSIQQNSEIKDLIFSLAGANSTSCLSRLGLTSLSSTFNAGTDYDLPLGALPSGGTAVTVERLYLSSQPGTDNLLSNSATNRVYSTQLKVKQRLNRGLASPLMPVALGVLNITVDSSNRIVGCGLDESSITATEACLSASGAVITSHGCLLEPNVEIISTCPSGTSLASGRCVASNVDCFNRTLGQQFDGYQFDCVSLPPTYAIRYPAGYAAPTPPPVELSTPTCSCGSETIAAGSPNLCIRGYSTTELGGNFDDMWQAKRCNSRGQLEPNSPNEFIFREDGTGVNFDYRVGSCVYSGESRYDDTIRYTIGSCL